MGSKLTSKNKGKSKKTNSSVCTLEIKKEAILMYFQNDLKPRTSQEIVANRSAAYKIAL